MKSGAWNLHKMAASFLPASVLVGNGNRHVQVNVGVHP